MHSGLSAARRKISVVGVEVERDARLRSMLRRLARCIVVPFLQVAEQESDSVGGEREDSE